MLKKIIIGLISIAAVTVLVVGGINRTIAKTTNYSESAIVGGTGRFSRSVNESDSHPIPLSDGRHASNSGTGRYIESHEVQNQDAVYQGGNGQGRQGGGREQDATNADPLNLAAEQFTELVKLEGTIVAVDLAEEVLIDTTDGQLILEGRSLSFAVEQGFTAQAGNDVLLEGFYEDADFEIVQITNHTSGQVVALRELTGRPLWAGGGRTW